MQGVLVQRRYGRDIMGGYFAAYTAAAIVGALAVAGASAAGVAVLAALCRWRRPSRSVVAFFGLRAFDPARAATPVGGHARSPLPRRGIWLFGFVILAAFTVDSAVSTWSTVYLQDELLAAAALAPLGYAAYQAAILITRLATDRASGRFGRAHVVLAATIASIVGCVAVALLPVRRSGDRRIRAGRGGRRRRRAARVHLGRRAGTRPQRRDHRAGQPVQLRGGGARRRSAGAARRRAPGSASRSCCRPLCSSPCCSSPAGSVRRSPLTRRCSRRSAHAKQADAAASADR